MCACLYATMKTAKVNSTIKKGKAKKVKTTKSTEKTPLTWTFSFHEVKRQQASLLFIAWDEDDSGRIPRQHLLSILYALFPSANSMGDGKVGERPSALSLREIRDAFLMTVGRPLSEMPYVTLKDVCSVLDSLWASPARRERMAQGCLYSVFTSVADSGHMMTRSALVEACNHIAGAAISEGMAEAILSPHGIAAGLLNEGESKINFSGFCKIMLPLLAV